MLETLSGLGIEVSNETGRAVALPASAQEVASIVREAGGEGWLVAPHWLDSDGLPERVVFVSTARLDEVRDVAPADLMAAAGAGVTVSALNARIAGGGLCWPPGDLLPEDAMLGDVFARLPGGWTIEGNMARRYLLVVEAVLANGEELRAGALPVKSVTGYDLKQLLVGSRGALGVVTGLTLRLEAIANRETVHERYRGDFEGLGGLASGGHRPARDGGRVILQRLKSELDPDGVFPAVDVLFGGGAER